MTTTLTPAPVGTGVSRVRVAHAYCLHCHDERPFCGCDARSTRTPIRRPYQVCVVCADLTHAGACPHCGRVWERPPRGLP